MAASPAGSPASKIELFDFRTIGWKVALLLTAIGSVIYANSLHCAFQFDDAPAIVNNLCIRDLSDLSAIASFDPARFLTYLTFAVNYHWSGLDVTGYHVANIAIHILNSWLVFLLVWLTAQTPLLRSKITAADAGWIGIFSALIFLSHPIQTQAVTYIVQRAASLATLFYLGTLLCYVMARLTQGRRWYLAACLACVAGMFTKQIAFTLPFMIVLYDLTFFSQRSRLGGRSAIWFLPFFLTLLIIPGLTGHHWSTVQAKHLPSPMDGAAAPFYYLLTQFNVIRTYLRLLLFPVGQSLVHDYAVSRHFWDPGTVLSFLLLCSLMGFAVLILRKQRLMAFGIFWFFLTLVVESSFFPIVDVIFEHRLYLPMAGFAITLTAALHAFVRRKVLFFALGVLLVLGLGALTIARNEVWKTEVRLWEDAVRKAPGASRSHFGLGTAYERSGRLEESRREYQRSLDIGRLKWRHSAVEQHEV